MRVEAAVVDRVSDADVSIQGDGAEVHDGRRGEEHVQVDPDGTKVEGQRPSVICRREEETVSACFLYRSTTAL